jgi:hypothetical protein
MTVSRARRPFQVTVFLLAAVTLVQVGCGGTTVPHVGEGAERAGAAHPANNASQPGEPVAEPSTFHSLGVRWPVQGDANGDALIAVSYRRRGETAWREAMHLFRPNPDTVSDENRVAGGWLFAGSIVDLLPDTEYEVVLVLTDPDGGSTRRMLTMRTRAELREPAGMRVRHVVPAGGTDPGPGTGAAGDPFRGLRAAQAAAEPGDLFLLHAGVYAEGTWTIDPTAPRPGRSSTGEWVTARRSSTAAGETGW